MLASSTRRLLLASRNRRSAVDFLGAQSASVADFYKSRRESSPISAAAIQTASIRYKSSTTAKSEGKEKDDNWRGNARHGAQHLRHRASEFRHSAKERYDDFREDPRETTKEGAKSISDLFRRYGPVFVGTYGTMYFITLGTLFVGVQSGALDPVSLFTYIGGSDAESKDTVQLVVEFMNDHAMTRPYADYINHNPNYANLAVAWVATKVTEPLRLAVAATATPRIAKYLGYTHDSQ